MSVNRRNFLGFALSAGAVTGFPALVSARSPNSKLAHACIGTAGMAGADMRTFAAHKSVEMTALCDVDAVSLAAAQKLFPNARVYRDWRELFAQEGDRIDSVNVSTPDHMHTAVAATAILHGKHVYCQKPLCKQIDECALLRKYAAEKGVTTQLGTQFAATPCDRHLIRLIQSGVIGPVHHAWLFSNRKGLSRVQRKLNAPTAVPARLDWDLWLGVAPVRPYAPGYHPTLWRIWTDFGSGWIGDMCTHIFSPLWLAMGLGKGAAKSVHADVNAECFTDPIYRQCWPRYSHITWTFDGTPASGGVPFKLDWVSGITAEPETPAAFLPPREFYELAAKTPLKVLPEEGRVVEGEKGWIVSPHGSAVPFVVFKDGTAGPKLPKLTRVPNHHHDFVENCLAGKASGRSDFSWSTYMMESILMGSICERLPRKTFTWDPVTRRFDSPEANALMTSHYRDGWKIPGLNG